MLKKWKESEFYKKMKQVRVNRAIYLSAVILLLALAVVLAVTAATNRSKKNPTVNPSDTQQVNPATQDHSGTGKNQDQPTINTDVVPELALPASGTLIKAHSVDVQVFSKTMNDYRTHLGIDIATAEDAPVCAAAAGTVSQLWEDPMMGWCVALSHAGDSVTVYKNLAENLADGIAVGNDVKQGQLLGYVGDSAILEIAEEPHLHMEMTVKGLQVDPTAYLNQTAAAALATDSSYEDTTDK